MHGLGSGGRLRHLCRSVRGIALFLTSSSYSLPPPAASSSILARFFSTSSMDGVAMAIYCGFVVRGDIVFCGWSIPSALSLGLPLPACAWRVVGWIPTISPALCTPYHRNNTSYYSFVG